MADSAFDKSQDPTPHRRQQAREEGQVAQSPDLASAALLISGLVILLIFGGRLVEFFVRLARQQLGGDAWLEADHGFIVNRGYNLLLELAQVIAPIMGL